MGVKRLCRNCGKRANNRPGGLCRPCWLGPARLDYCPPPRRPSRPKAPPGTRCRHCGKEAATLARGLGYRCYHDPAVRDLYEPKGTRKTRQETLDEALAAESRRYPPDYREAHRARVLQHMARVDADLRRLGREEW